MISPAAIKLIIRHFDSVDAAVSNRLTRKRPWSEPALTSLLCDLLDEETQLEEKLRYPLQDLNSDLKKLDGLLSFSYQVQTHEYDSRMERWVTQSDIGLIIDFDDHFLPRHSWSLSWLLQAKRLYPTTRNPPRFDETSRFEGGDQQQSERMKRLVQVVGEPFVLFLLYCPRPEFMDELTRQKLAHLRSLSLAGHIFDYTLGLQLHGELSDPASSLAAGLFVCYPEDPPKNLGGIHQLVLQRCTPFSWFLVEHLCGGRSFFRRDLGQRKLQPRRHSPDSWIEEIVTGEPDAIKRLLDALGEENREPFPVLPRHTLRVHVEVGADADKERRTIQLDEDEGEGERETSLRP